MSKNNYILSSYYSDERYLRLASEEGIIGIGVFHLTLQLLCEAPEGKLSSEKLVAQLNQMGVKESTLYRLIYDYKLFSTDGKIIWSQEFVDGLTQRKSISEKRKAAAAKRWQRSSSTVTTYFLSVESVTADGMTCGGDANASTEHANASFFASGGDANASTEYANASPSKEKKKEAKKKRNIYTLSEVIYLSRKKESTREKKAAEVRDVERLEEKNGGGRAETTFTERKEKSSAKKENRNTSITQISSNPPTVAMVAEYVTENKFAVDPESFVAYYTSNGWYVGNRPMKSWQASVMAWHRRTTTGDSKKHSTAPKSYDGQAVAKRNGLINNVNARWENRKPVQSFNPKDYGLI